MMGMKSQNYTPQARSITNEIMLLYFQNVNEHKILLLSPKGLKTKKGLIYPQLNLLCLQTHDKVMYINDA